MDFRRKPLTCETLPVRCETGVPASAHPGSATTKRTSPTARRVHGVDSRGGLDIAADRDNELHPNSKGFRKLATGPWRAALANYGFA